MDKQIYFGNWKDKESMWKDFQRYRGRDTDPPSPAIPVDINVLLAWYGDGCYSGSAFVVYEQANKLYEVHGSHCSCYGLEGQWDPEECTVESLKKIGMCELKGDHYDESSNALMAFGALIAELEAQKTPS